MSDLLSLHPLHKRKAHLSWPHFDTAESQPREKKPNTHTRERQWQACLPHAASLSTPRFGSI